MSSSVALMDTASRVSNENRHYVKDNKEAWQLGLGIIISAAVYHEYMSIWTSGMLLVVRAMLGIAQLKVKRFERPESLRVPPFFVGYFCGFLFLLTFIAANSNLVSDVDFRFECIIITTMAFTTLLRYIICVKRLQIVQKCGWGQVLLISFIVNMLCLVACLCFYLYNSRNNYFALVLINIYELFNRLSHDNYLFSLFQVISPFKDKNNQSHGQSIVDKCSICREKMDSKEFLCELPCKHLFHSHCILPWLEQKSICPNCRSDVFSHMQSRFKLPIAVWNGIRSLICFSYSMHQKAEQPSDDECVNADSKEAHI